MAVRKMTRDRRGLVAEVDVHPDGLAVTVRPSLVTLGEYNQRVIAAVKELESALDEYAVGLIKERIEA